MSIQLVSRKELLGKSAYIDSLRTYEGKYSYFQDDYAIGLISGDISYKGTVQNQISSYLDAYSENYKISAYNAYSSKTYTIGTGISFLKQGNAYIAKINIPKQSYVSSGYSFIATGEELTGTYNGMNAGLEAGKAYIKLEYDSLDPADNIKYVSLSNVSESGLTAADGIKIENGTVSLNLGDIDASYVYIKDGKLSITGIEKAYDSIYSLVEALSEGKQNVLSLGEGLKYDSEGKLAVTLDRSLFEIVTVSDINEITSANPDKIYLKKADDAEGNIYKEYAYVFYSDSYTWEELGSYIDISNLTETIVFDVPLESNSEGKITLSYDDSFKVIDGKLCIDFATESGSNTDKAVNQTLLNIELKKKADKVHSHEIGTSTSAGFAYIYNETGDNDNGTMSQAAISSSLNALRDTISDTEYTGGSYINIKGNVISAYGLARNEDIIAYVNSYINDFRDNLSAYSYIAFDKVNDVIYSYDIVSESYLSYRLSRFQPSLEAGAYINIDNNMISTYDLASYIDTLYNVKQDSLTPAENGYIDIYNEDGKNYIRLAYEDIYSYFGDKITYLQGEIGNKADSEIVANVQSSLTASYNITISDKDENGYTYISAYGLQETLSAGSGIMLADNIVSLDLFTVVDSLGSEPEEGNEKKIHLLKASSSSTDNNYIEYIWLPGTDTLTGAWEKLGDINTSSLSDYLKASDLTVSVSDSGFNITKNDVSYFVKAGENLSGSVSGNSYIIDINNITEEDVSNAFNNAELN